MTGDFTSNADAAAAASPSFSPAQRLAAGALACLICALLALLYLVFHLHLVQQLDPALVEPVATSMADATDAQVEALVAERETLALRRMANALPLFALSLLLLAITRRPLLSLWLALLATCSLYAIDALKFENLHAHLLPADALLLPQILQGSDLYWAYANTAGFGYTQALAFVVVTGMLCLEPGQAWLRPWLRAALAVVALTLGHGLVTGNPVFDRWYQDQALGFTPWHPDASIERTGLIAGLIKLAGEAPWQLPPADEVYVDHVLAMHAKLPADNAGSAVPARMAREQPDIILWQSESLFDVNRLTALGDTPHLRRMQDLRARSLHGDLKVPTYGGGTVRTEFEALTGYPLRAFAGIKYPYSALAQRPLMALPRLLRAHGYQTVAIHPYEASFWSRDIAMSHLGFDRFEDHSSFRADDYHGIYIGDHALLRRVGLALEQAVDTPVFVFAISMENHGPWQRRPRIDRQRLDRIEVPAALPPAAATELRYFLYHIDRADEQLEQLIQLVDASPRHTIVLFYGDHLPGLERVWRELAFRDGQPAWEQPVPFILYDNRRALRGRADGELRSYHLASLLLDAAGLDNDPRFRVVSADRERHGRTGLNATTHDPVLDYEHALQHLSWHQYRQAVPDIAPP